MSVVRVTIFWLYQAQDYFLKSKKETSYVGLAILLAGIFIQFVSYLLRFYFLSGFAFVMVLFGAVFFLYGKEIMKKTWFPIAFLLLMVPLPLLVISQITLKLKFFVSDMATWLINATGFQAIQEGSYIYLPHAVLLVGDPCSGLRSFLAFLCLGFVFAYDEKLVMWKKVVFVVAGLPLAVISNVARVYFLGLVGEFYGIEYTGPGTMPHDASGIAVFVIAFACFLYLRKILGDIKS